MCEGVRYPGNGFLRVSTVYILLYVGGGVRSMEDGMGVC